MVGDERLALPASVAARATGATERQINYWADTGLVVPAVERRVGKNRRVRLWGFQELVELGVVVQLQHRSISKQELRRVIADVRSRRSIDRPLLTLKFGVDTNSGNLYYIDPDGYMEAAQRPGQGVLEETIDLEEIRQRISRARERSHEHHGKVVRRRGLKSSKPVFAGTRTPIEVLRPYFDRGYSTDRILQAFPHLNEDDLAAARSELRSAS